MAYYSRKLKMPFQDVLSKVTETLRKHGFGIITSIDLQDTFKQKLNIGFRKYKILGACNPQFAYKAISLESHMGVMLPCNIVVQEHENGDVEVSIVNPEELMHGVDNLTLKTFATEMKESMQAVLSRL